MAERFRTASSGSLFIDAPTLGAKTVLFVALAIVMMMIDRREGALTAVRSTLEVVVYPLQLAVDAPSAFGRWVGERPNRLHRQRQLHRAPVSRHRGR